MSNIIQIGQDFKQKVQRDREKPRFYGKKKQVLKAYYTNKKEFKRDRIGSRMTIADNCRKKFEHWLTLREPYAKA